MTRKIILMTSIAALFAVLLTSTSLVSAEEAPEFLFEFGSFGTGDGQLDFPSGIEFDSDDNIYVTATGNDRVQKFTSDGTYVAQWGSSGNGDGQFNRPYAQLILKPSNIS